MSDPSCNIGALCCTVHHVSLPSLGAINKIHYHVDEGVPSHISLIFSACSSIVALPILCWEETTCLTWDE